MNNIAGIMIQQGFYDEAQHYAGEALNLRKDYLPSLVNMGIASIKLNDAKEAERYLSKAVAVDPSNRLALINLSLLYEKQQSMTRLMHSITNWLNLEMSVDTWDGRIDEKKGKTRMRSASTARFFP